jgi:hypothetical protein
LWFGSWWVPVSEASGRPSEDTGGPRRVLGDLLRAFRALGEWFKKPKSLYSGTVHLSGPIALSLSTLPARLLRHGSRVYPGPKYIRGLGIAGSRVYPGPGHTRLWAYPGPGWARDTGIPRWVLMSRNRPACRSLAGSDVGSSSCLDVAASGGSSSPTSGRFRRFQCQCQSHIGVVCRYARCA